MTFSNCRSVEINQNYASPVSPDININSSNHYHRYTVHIPTNAYATCQTSWPVDLFCRNTQLISLVFFGLTHCCYQPRSMIHLTTMSCDRPASDKRRGQHDKNN